MITEKIIYIGGKPVVVTEEVYYTYYKMKRREKTLIEKDSRNRLIHYDAWDSISASGRDSLPDASAPSPEEVVIARITRDKLRRCLALLPKEERELITAIFFEGKRLSALSANMNIPYRTLGCRRDRILKKLRRMMEK